MKKKSSVKTGLILLCAVSVLLALCAAVFAAGLHLLSPATDAGEERVSRIEIPSGTGVRAVASMLAQKQLIRSEKMFYIAARYPVIVRRNHPFMLKSGVYPVSSAMSVHEILDLLESGKQEYIKTVIPEGLTLSKIAAELEENGVCGADEFKSAARSPALLSEYKIPAENFEGYLFPDTYFFTPMMRAEDVLRMMADTFFKRIQTLEIAPSKGGGNVSPEQLHQIVILASIVEREYRIDSEAPLIASVFTNRIKVNSGLYSCATIEYIITEIMGKPHPDVITYDDLKIDNPYNTYKWAGLTPGPISNPGMVALQAAANPPATDYFYFTLTDSAAGSHTFTESLSSHAQAGAQFKFRTKKAAASK
ncbi:MAG: endolytic transglycosylase MltG [Treponema sp.]|nr:endolytic transglycosylase MltG [Treponema sp.]